MLHEIIEQWIGEEEKNNIITQGEDVCASAYRQALADLKSRIPELEGKIVGEIGKNLPDERKISHYGDWSAETYEEKMLALSVIKTIINTLKGGKE